MRFVVHYETLIFLTKQVKRHDIWAQIPNQLPPLRYYYHTKHFLLSPP